MKVITFTIEDFKSACHSLQKTVARSGFKFDTLVGIASGGDYVANQFDSPNIFSVAMRRPSTASKQGIASLILPYLPAFLCRWLRIAEAKWLQWRNSRRPANQIPDCNISPFLAKHLESPRNVLIVDDAVDSGITLKAVYDAIKKRSPKSTIMTAAITQTQRNPVAKPDFALFRNETLIRFPWAKDMRYHSADIL